jgi:hypothetical protein
MLTWMYGTGAIVFQIARLFRHPDYGSAWVLAATSFVGLVAGVYAQHRSNIAQR